MRGSDGLLLRSLSASDRQERLLGDARLAKKSSGFFYSFTFKSCTTESGKAQGGQQVTHAHKHARMHTHTQALKALRPMCSEAVVHPGVGEEEEGEGEDEE